MADAKNTALTANSDPQQTDLMVIVDDPSGSPLTQKITVENVALVGLGAELSTGMGYFLN